ncbi:MAG: fatty acid desaturase [Candidatus Omnitrophica bacterium]|nr:fatty acid desaturase [Candidatus Omnitrophota bacterium]MCB9748035.1 fatty acid desaturase [Candidatus Omnitrophota bacterium]
MIKDEKYPIPGTLNIVISIVQLTLLCSILIGVSMVQSWMSIFWLAICYGIVMNSSYAMVHEAEHNLLHPNRRINNAFGVVLALFFPAPFHLIRQGHLGHHMRNRSDDEAFDIYFEGDNVVIKQLQFYGILTGMFWVMILLSNFISAFYPQMLSSKSVYKKKFDRPMNALLETLNPKYLVHIRLEAMAIFILHGSLMWLFQMSFLKYMAVIFGFGFMWSAMQYVHHYGTERDVQKGALNLKTFALLDFIWLNHNWHLRHHLNPTISWIYLPKIYEGKKESRDNMFVTYFKMWKGAQKSDEHVMNQYSGRVIR